MDIIRKLYIAIVRPHLEYASHAVLHGIHIYWKDQQTLENIQKCACKVGLKRWDSNYPAMLRTLGSAFVLWLHEDNN